MTVRYVTHIPRKARKLASWWSEGCSIIIFAHDGVFYALLDVGNPLYNITIKVQASGVKEAIRESFSEFGVFPRGDT